MHSDCSVLQDGIATFTATHALMPPPVGWTVYESIDDGRLALGGSGEERDVLARIDIDPKFLSFVSEDEVPLT